MNTTPALLTGPRPIAAIGPAPKAPAATLEGMTGSRIVAALEATYEAIRRRHPDLPEILFITGTGLMGRGAKWGHFARDRWVVGNGAIVDTETGRLAEIFIAGERLACGAADTLQTLLHEAVHALAVVRDVKEVSRDFRYHNRRFVALAEELGLVWPEDTKPHPVIGFSAVVLAEGTLEDYAEEVAALQAAIVAHLDTFQGLLAKGDDDKAPAGGEAPKVAPRPKAPSRSNAKAACGCGRIIRASRKVLAEAPITCGVCGQDFQPED
jgi:hypothetical protein